MPQDSASMGLPKIFGPRHLCSYPCVLDFKLSQGLKSVDLLYLVNNSVLCFRVIITNLVACFKYITLIWGIWYHFRSSYSTHRNIQIVEEVIPFSSSQMDDFT